MSWLTNNSLTYVYILIPGRKHGGKCTCEVPLQGVSSRSEGITSLISVSLPTAWFCSCKKSQFESDDGSNLVLFRLVLSVLLPNASYHTHAITFLLLGIQQFSIMRSNDTLLTELSGLGLICAELEEKAHQDLDWFTCGSIVLCYTIFPEI